MTSKTSNPRRLAGVFFFLAFGLLAQVQCGHLKARSSEVAVALLSPCTFFRARPSVFSGEKAFHTYRRYA